MTSDWTSKPANQWQRDDLRRLAENAIEEGPYLEFKKVDELMRAGTPNFDLLAEELAETASAFLNSDGGVLLIGVQTDRGTSSSTAEKLRPLANWEFDKTFEHNNLRLTAGAIRDRILGNIMPKPLGVDVKAIELTIESKTSSVLVATIPASYLGRISLPASFAITDAPPTAMCPCWTMRSRTLTVEELVHCYN